MQKETDRVSSMFSGLLMIMVGIIVMALIVSKVNIRKADNDESYERYRDHKFISEQGSKPVTFAVPTKDFNRLRPMYLSHLEIVGMTEDIVVLRGTGRLVELAFYRLYNTDIIKHKNNDLNRDR